MCAKQGSRVALLVFLHRSADPHTLPRHLTYIALGISAAIYLLLWQYANDAGIDNVLEVVYVRQDMGHRNQEYWSIDNTN